MGKYIASQPRVVGQFSSESPSLTSSGCQGAWTKRLSPMPVPLLFAYSLGTRFYSPFRPNQYSTEVNQSVPNVYHDILSYHVYIQLLSKCLRVPMFTISCKVTFQPVPIVNERRARQFEAVALDEHLNHTQHGVRYDGTASSLRTTV